MAERDEQQSSGCSACNQLGQVPTVEHLAGVARFDARQQAARNAESLEAENARLRERVAELEGALEASRISHLDVEGDPFFSCPIARGGSCMAHDMDGQCPCGCRCGADEHNARIDAALAGQEQAGGAV